MEEEFVPYSLALELKELGFNEICLTYYNFDGKIERSDDWAFGVDMEHKRDRNQCLAPLWQQAFDWLFNTFSYICTITNNMTYEQKENILNEAIRYIQNNLSK